MIDSQNFSRYKLKSKDRKMYKYFTISKNQGSSTIVHFSNPRRIPLPSSFSPKKKIIISAQHAERSGTKKKKKKINHGERHQSSKKKKKKKRRPRTEKQENYGLSISLSLSLPFFSQSSIAIGSEAASTYTRDGARACACSSGIRPAVMCAPGYEA